MYDNFRFLVQILAKIIGPSDPEGTNGSLLRTRNALRNNTLWVGMIFIIFYEEQTVLEQMPEWIPEWTDTGSGSEVDIDIINQNESQNGQHDDIYNNKNTEHTLA